MTFEQCLEVCEEFNTSDAATCEAIQQIIIPRIESELDNMTRSDRCLVSAGFSPIFQEDILRITAALAAARTRLQSVEAA